MILLIILVILTFERSYKFHHGNLLIKSDFTAICVITTNIYLTHMHALILDRNIMSC